MTDHPHPGSTDRPDAPPPPQKAPPPHSAPAGPTEDAVARGRDPRTPFMLLGGVALAAWASVAVVAVVVLLVWWLT
jgi:hypothetical protein